MIVLFGVLLVCVVGALALARYAAPAPVLVAAPDPPGPDPLPDPVPSSPSLPASPGDMRALIARVAREERYARADLATAIAFVESSLNPLAFNPNDHAPLGVADPGDSYGLMGLKLATARVFCPWLSRTEDLFDAESNARAGIRFLVQLETRWAGQYGLEGVVQMYNLGEPRFLGGERSPDYLARVQRALA